MNCYECNAPMSIRSSVERVRIGDTTVLDSSCGVLTCDNGHTFIDAEEYAKYQRRAAIVVMCEAPAVGGAEFKHARRILQLTQARLAQLIGVTQETVSRWETNVLPIQKDTRVLMAGLLSEPTLVERLEHPQDGPDLRVA